MSEAATSYAFYPIVAEHGPVIFPVKLLERIESVFASILHSAFHVVPNLLIKGHGSDEATDKFNLGFSLFGHGSCPHLSNGYSALLATGQFDLDALGEKPSL